MFDFIEVEQSKTRFGVELEGPNDKNPNGLFTRMLLSEMRAPGIRVDNMIREVRRKVVDAAKSVGHDQVPAIYDQVVGDFYFNK